MAEVEEHRRAQPQRHRWAWGVSFFGGDGGSGGWCGNGVGVVSGWAVEWWGWWPVGSGGGGGMEVKWVVTGWGGGCGGVGVHDL